MEYQSIKDLFANYNGDYTPIEFDACDIGKEVLFDTSCFVEHQNDSFKE